MTTREHFLLPKTIASLITRVFHSGSSIKANHSTATLYTNTAYTASTNNEYVDNTHHEQCRFYIPFSFANFRYTRSQTNATKCRSFEKQDFHCYRARKFEFFQAVCRNFGNDCKRVTSIKRQIHTAHEPDECELSIEPRDQSVQMETYFSSLK